MKTRRRFSRIPLSREIKVTSDGRSLKDCRLREISLGNALVITPEASSIPLSHELHLECEVITPERLLCIEIEAEVVRVESGGCAVRYVEMDVESLDALYSLLLMVSDNERALRDEFVTMTSLNCAQSVESEWSCFIS